MGQAVTIHHDLGDIVMKPNGKINAVRLKKVIRTALDQYQSEENVPAKVVHAEAERRHDNAYQSIGYYLKLYRLRRDFTQVELASKTGIRQHHLSEMEHNKRPLGKVNAKKLAEILDCDYRQFL